MVWATRGDLHSGTVRKDISKPRQTAPAFENGMFREQFLSGPHPSWGQTIIYIFFVILLLLNSLSFFVCVRLRPQSERTDLPRKCREERAGLVVVGLCCVEKTGESRAKP
eukprot:Hpha_TRINITY_DN15659_c4_g1::TRINITY_DN15659_c4_g1_i2::g.101412::m.101412